MPQMTVIEDTLLTGLEAQADALKNGSGGDDRTMRHVVADTAKVVAAMARGGGPTWNECKEFRASAKRSVIDWKATLVICGTVFGIIWKVLS